MMNFWFEPPEDKILCTCCKCRGEIYDGELYGEGEKGYYCIDCVRDMLRELSDGEAIELLGMEVRCGTQ